MKRAAALLLTLLLSLPLLGGSCGRNEGDGDDGQVDCGGSCPQQSLSITDVETIHIEGVGLGAEAAEQAVNAAVRRASTVAGTFASA